MENIKVVIIMGSKSDLAVMEEAAKVLKDFGVLYEMKVLSAHRTPEETAQYAQGLKGRGVQAVICGAGMSAALSGVVAAHTTLPVIGVPLEASSLDGIDALLSTVMMPPGVPVGAVAIGIPGAKNAAYLALRIMGVTDKDIEGKLEDFRKEQARKILDIKL
ncbi:MAG: 5-(carboxyamino)imidazole ribonucleotide mutase [Omnitrophica WOR_2 bacterium GWF2_38_59]|nr:MAG: 5-(carboxyamino)imidazole ribonucleotide mutase [Omnitrophica WOR_2 bacterium GWA2_37_7]OGX22871.1 MAG: 5-(carboxyamino)imidazole ribonucleotide mutase [Omnitrophica WOR_2 bacterium GWF2_38_59]OGX48556.1 MAG: 5-(carboxyamino)imidazole ribonucleotide mutase [Omnitrophica WOR_2 bacterium RIFOXYA2_FULL_38_17]OGX52781.1 MAG: 5-(carboxyamino)imidazole ribonucleotide mutase [Omnitrophica WOR_2 bacterium RIFOXYA12_FULL_38_10]OGX58955.1 MAG: 5-(carboxyamino)imidazole ribonucleotide mutase [Omni